MIPKLKRKFILINMSLVSLVLIVVFVTIGFSTYERTKGESFMAMDRLLGKATDGPIPLMEIGVKKPDKHGPLVPAFCVVLDENLDIATITRDNVSVSDEVVSRMVEEVLAGGKQSGVIWDADLRFSIRETPFGRKIAFADMNREIETMLNLSVVLLLVGLGALGAFLAISIYLARWALKPVEQAWEQQKRFVADASHELRTPLTVILANTGILLSHKEDPIDSQIKWIEHTQTEALRMKKLVDDLLFLAKADSEHKPKIESTVNFSDALWSCLLPFESVAYENNISIHSDIQPDLTLHGDENQLKQLAVILIDNACKYAGTGGNVSIELKQHKEHILLKVRNTGAQIPQEDLQHIFERFYRVDSARTRDQGGYGLGLAIAHSIVQNHGGSISAHSNEKDGNIFEVHFN